MLHHQPERKTEACSLKQASVLVCNALLIKEPEDVGEGGLCKGNTFPPTLSSLQGFHVAAGARIPAPVFSNLVTTLLVSCCTHQNSATWICCFSPGFTKGDPNTQHCPALWKTSASICGPSSAPCCPPCSWQKR